MTKQELIDHLQHLEHYTHYSEDAPALREVIEMLKCSEMPNSSEERTQERTRTHACDPIERQDAIDAMTNTLWHYPNECYKNLSEHEFAKGLAELGLKSVPSAQPDLSEYSDKLWRSAYERGKAEAKPERKTGEWIPCDDKVPIVSGEFLVTLTDADGEWVSTAEWNTTFGGRWQDIFPDDGYRDISNVIAWMPLPAPYQGEGEEE